MMKALKVRFVLAVLLLVNPSQGKVPDKKVEMNYVRPMHGEMGGQEVYFLYRLKQLDNKGRYLNQSLEDLEQLAPSCPCINNPSLCNSDCCYCHLKCAVPENSFTGEMMIPRTTACSRDDIKSHHYLTSGKKEVRATVPWQCTKVDNYHGTSSRLLPLVCIHEEHLKSYKLTFNINPGLTLTKRLNYHSTITTTTSTYNWHKHGKLSNLTNTTNPNRINGEDLLRVKDEGLVVVDKGMNGTVSLNGMNFTLEDERGDGKVIQVLSHPQFSVKGVGLCFEAAGGHSLGECVYFIKTGSLESCDQLRDAVNITTHIVAYILSKRRTDGVTPLGKDERNKSEVDKCSGVPSHGVITEVLHRNTFINLYINFEKYKNYGEDFEGASLTLTYKRLYISDQQLKNLPKFWDEFAYGKCTESYCWRDIGKIGNPEASRMSRLDEILVRNLIYCFMPFIPFLVYCFVDIFMSF